MLLASEEKQRKNACINERNGEDSHIQTLSNSSLSPFLSFSLSSMWLVLSFFLLNREVLLSAAVLTERKKYRKNREGERDEKWEKERRIEKKEKSREQMLVTIGPHPIPSPFFQY